MFSVPGQVMHVVGRLTIPIMSFFIAEGYRKTSNLKRYFSRMVIFALISVGPFYLFFGEEYGYRQNFIFDLLLALTVLTICDSSRFKRPVKVILSAVIFVLSFAIGGWPVYPIILVLIFYYGKSFKQKALLMGGFTLFLEAFIICGILINNNWYPFLGYDWKWYQWLYFLGFLLAIPLLKLYNGERGNYPVGRYFFFMFYPIHFLILYGLKKIGMNNAHSVYMGSLVFVFVLTIMFAMKLIQLRPSRALIVAITMAISGMLYVFGFILEVLTGTLDMAYAGTIIQYLAECGVFLSFMWFMGEFCQKKIPLWINTIAISCCIIIVTLLLTVNQNHLFYRSMSMDTTSGAFPRLTLVYGPGFFFFVTYAMVFCIGMIAVCVSVARKGSIVTKKRTTYMVIAILCPWIAFLLKITPFTNGYEVSSIGVFGSIVTIYYSIIKYGFFDSVQIAVDNVLHSMDDGILVVNPEYVIKYRNSSMEKLIPKAAVDTYALDIPVLRDLFNEVENRLFSNNKIYSVYIQPLMEQNEIQGYMLKTTDMTDYLMQLDQAEKYAHSDPLTGLHNRNYYTRLYNEYRKEGGTGTFIMIDLDNFKGVNDRLGHDGGDTVLVLLSKTISKISGRKHIACRLGGDEYSMFLKDVTDEAEVERICAELIDSFSSRLSDAKLPVETSISVGAVIVNKINYHVDKEDFRQYYRLADQALYEAKNAGKKVYRISKG